MTIAFPRDRVQPATIEHEPAEVLAFPSALTEQELGAIFGELILVLHRLHGSAPKRLLLEVQRALDWVLNPGPRVA